MKKKVLFIIIPIILIIVIAAAVIIGLFLKDKDEEKKEDDSTGSKWGDTYYAYLKDATKDEDITKYGLDSGMKDIKLQFCEVEKDSNPAMVMSYKKEDKSYVNVYQIDENENVSYNSYVQPTEIEYLYNIEKDEYDWYVHESTSEADSYSSLKSVVGNSENVNTKSENTIVNKRVHDLEAEYTIKKNEAEISQETVDGKTIKLDKFDQIFVKPEVTIENQIDFNEDLKAGEIKEKIAGAVEGYKTNEELISEEIEEAVSEKKEETEKKLEEIETAKEALKKKEEEEKKKAEEEAAKGLKIGEYTLKYGRYEWDVGQIFTLILYKDGKCRRISPDGEVIDGTYKLDTMNFTQDGTPAYHLGIRITDSKYGDTLYPIDNNSFTDGDVEHYIYVGEE